MLETLTENITSKPRRFCYVADDGCITILTGKMRMGLSFPVRAWLRAISSVHHHEATFAVHLARVAYLSC